MNHKSILRLQLLFLIYSSLKICLITSQTSTDFNTNEKSRLIDEKRSYYSVNLLVALNSTLEFPSLKDSFINLWLMTRLTNSTYWQQSQNLSQSIQVKPYPIFDVGSPAVRNSSIRESFRCSPSETDCSQLSIPNFKVKFLGQYTSISRSFDYIFDYRVEYNVSTYVKPLAFECTSTKCQYNDSMQTLSVKQNEPVQLSCSILIAQNNQHALAAEISIRSDTNEECTGETTLNQVADTSAYAANGDNNVLLYHLTKTCTKTFSKYDQAKSFSCQLIPKEQEAAQAPLELQQTQIFENLIVKVNVNYGPELDLLRYNSSQTMHNRTVTVDSVLAVIFTCPFKGNPSPNWYWSVPSVVMMNEGNETSGEANRQEFYLTTQDYAVPSIYTSQVGSYVFECKAQVMGLVNEYSSVAQFTLNVRAKPVIVNSKKAISMNSVENPLIQKESDNNKGAIIGGTIGGFVVLFLIILLVIFLVRKSRNSKDDIEKAKEIDIDITDSNDNPHLNSRNNLTDTTKSQQVNESQNGGGQKKLMIPQSTHAQSYAAIAHAAAAAAQSNLQRNNNLQQNASGHQMNDNSGCFNTGSVNNLLSSSNSQTDNLLSSNIKSQSYNNPGFFDSAAYSIPQNPLESPPPYDAALQQPIKKNSPIHQQQQNQNQQHNFQQQQRDYMGSSSKLISGHNTPTQPKHLVMSGGGSGSAATSHSYSVQPHNNNNMPLLNANQSASLQQIQHQMFQQQQQQQHAHLIHQQSNLQYTTVQSLENRARSRNPLNGMPNEIENQSQQPTQYSNIAQLSSNPIDV